MRKKPHGSLWLSMVALLLVPALAACAGSGDGDLAVGDPAPSFSLPEANGSTVSLEDYAGSAALLYFHMADG